MEHIKHLRFFITGGRSGSGLLVEDFSEVMVIDSPQNFFDQRGRFCLFHSDIQFYSERIGYLQDKLQIITNLVVVLQ